MLNLKEFEPKKAEILAAVSAFLDDRKEEVLKTKDGEIAIPIVGTENSDGWLVIRFIVPKGSRDGEEYDGYAEHEAYEMTLRKRQEKAEEKARKIAKDAEKRAAKEKKEEGE